MGPDCGLLQWEFTRRGLPIASLGAVQFPDTRAESASVNKSLLHGSTVRES